MKTAIVTGASAGLGIEFAKLFAADGHSLVLVARRGGPMRRLAEEFRTAHPTISCRILEMDLGRPGAGAELFEKTKDLEIEFLVNNAGFGLAGRFAGLDHAQQLQMIDLNTRTLVELTHLYLPQMLKRGSGRILNVGSVAGFQPGPLMAVYYATKAFVNSFSEALHEELKGSGVSCTVLAPGFTKTEFQSVASLASQKTGIAVASAESVARAGYRAMLEGDSMRITGGVNKLLLQTLRVSPRFLVRKIAGQMNQAALKP